MSSEWVSEFFCELLQLRRNDLTQQGSTEGFLLPPWEEYSIAAPQLSQCHQANVWTGGLWRSQDEKLACFLDLARLSGSPAPQGRAEETPLLLDGQPCPAACLPPQHTLSVPVSLSPWTKEAQSQVGLVFPIPASIPSLPVRFSGAQFPSASWLMHPSEAIRPALPNQRAQGELCSGHCKQLWFCHKCQDWRKRLMTLW